MDELGPAVLQATGLVKRYGDLAALDGVDLSVGAGTVCGLLGRNGAGKTTLLRIILGLLAPDAGTVRLFDRDVSPHEVMTRRRVAGFVEEPTFYPYLSALRNLELLARLDDAGDTITGVECLELVGLADRRDEKVRGFSTGMRQRLGIAAALLRSPDLLILDEPTIGLDPASAGVVRKLVRDRAATGTAVLLSSHNMTEVADICDRVVIIDAGRVVWQGSLDRLREQAPAAAFRLWTSDDVAARRLGRELELDVGVDHPTDGLMIRLDDAARDAFVLELGGRGIAVRQLEPDISALESMFVALTAGGSDDEVRS